MDRNEPVDLQSLCIKEISTKTYDWNGMDWIPRNINTYNMSAFSHQYCGELYTNDWLCWTYNVYMLVIFEGYESVGNTAFV